MSEKTFYSPLVERARRDLWGKNGLIEPEDWEAFFSAATRDQARYLGARVRCPLVETLADDVKYGPEYQVNRYGNVAFMFGLLKKEMEEVAVPFAADFGAEVDLTPYGGIRKHDTGWVPENQKMTISGAETYYGFVLPRQVLDIIATAETREKAVELLIEAQKRILASENLDEAVARLAQLSLECGIKLNSVKERMVPEDYRAEVPDEYVLPIFSRVTSLMTIASPDGIK